MKKTVNQDNPFMYHLFYGDLTGSAGTELSFFEMPNVGRTIRGTNAITQIGLLVPSIESLTFWKRRFESLQVAHGEITTYAGRDALHFEDPDGLRLVLLNNKDEEVPEYWTAWDESSVEQNHRILGMGTVEMTVRSLNKLSKTLTGLFSYKEVSRSDDEGIYQSIDGQSFGEILVKQQDGESERPGKGSIHHLAIRVKNDEELSYWNEAVKDKGFNQQGLSIAFILKVYISVSQMAFYLRLQRMDQDLQ